MNPGEIDCRSEIEAIYADLGRRPVDRDCTLRSECCQFRLTGLTPNLTLGEAMFAAIGVRAAGRKKLPERTDGACPLLGRNGRCTIYAHRPLGCRTHFCAAAGGMIDRKEVIDLIHRLEDLDQRLGGDGPRRLPTAVADALESLKRR